MKRIRCKSEDDLYIILTIFQFYWWKFIVLKMFKFFLSLCTVIALIVLYISLFFYHFGKHSLLFICCVNFTYKTCPITEFWNEMIYHMTISIDNKFALLALVIIKTRRNIELYWWEVNSPNGWFELISRHMNVHSYLTINQSSIYIHAKPL